MNKNVLIIAGGGFLGKQLIRYLKCTFTGRLACADLVDPKIEGVHFYLVNVLSSTDESMFSLVKDFDIVINCSGQITNPINTCLLLNSEGIMRIVKAVRLAGNFLLHFSTVTVYGSCMEASETTEQNPETPYSAAKAFAEIVILNNLLPEKSCVIRLSNLFGEDQPKGIFSYIRRSYNADRKLFFNNDGEMIRYYLHVEDCAEITVGLIENGSVSGVYNLIGPDKYTIKDLVKVAENISGVAFEASFESIKPWDNTGIISDKKIREKIEIIYKRSVATGFANMLNFN